MGALVTRSDVDWLGKLFGRLGVFLIAGGVTIFLTPRKFTFKGSVITIGVPEQLALQVTGIGTVLILLAIILVFLPWGKEAKILP